MPSSIVSLSVEVRTRELKSLGHINFSGTLKDSEVEGKAAWLIGEDIIRIP
jgi:hypothetical protein